MAHLTIAQIQERAYATAVAKGWHERPLRDGEAIDHDRVLAKLALVHSEIAELTEAYERHQLALRYEGPTQKPEGFGAEAADIVIRVCDLCGALGLNLTDSAPFRLTDDCLGWSTSLAEVGEFYLRLTTLRGRVDVATEAARVDDWPAFLDALGRVVVDVSALCNALGVSLGEAVAAKMDYNDTRPHRHGGKSA